MPDKVAPVEDPIVEIQNVHRFYEPTHALKGVSCKVYRGEVVALLGPNGAGKTTLGAILTGRETPDHGRALFHIDGEAERPEPAQVSYFPGDSSFYTSLAVERLLFHAATQKGLTAAEAAEATQYWIDRLGLSARPTVPLANLSRGNQQKVQFAEAVLHGPALIYLDEPFSGLDPINQEWVIGLVRELQELGTTIVVSDHNLHLVERISNRTLILYQGRIVASGSLQDLRQRAQIGTRIRLRPIDPRALDMSVFQGIAGLRTVERTASGEVRLLTRSDARTGDVLNAVKAKVRLSEILAEAASLHDIYLHVFRNVQAQEAASPEQPAARPPADGVAQAA